MNAQDFARNALAKFEQRHAATDSPLFNSAGFFWDAARKVFVVTVRDCIVCEPKTLAGVKEFSAMHNNRLAESIA